MYATMQIMYDCALHTIIGVGVSVDAIVGGAVAVIVILIVSIVCIFAVSYFKNAMLPACEVDLYFYSVNSKEQETACTRRGVWCGLLNLPSELSLLHLSIQIDLAIQYEVEVLTDHLGLALTSPEVTVSYTTKAEGFVAVALSMSIFENISMIYYVGQF